MMTTPKNEMTMNYIELKYAGKSKFNVVTIPWPSENPIGACCGSNWVNTNKKLMKHYGIVIYPEDVKVSFSLKKDKHTTDKITTKNGVFNVSVRLAR